MRTENRNFCKEGNPLLFYALADAEENKTFLLDYSHMSADMHGKKERGSSAPEKRGGEQKYRKFVQPFRRVGGRTVKKLPENLKNFSDKKGNFCCFMAQGGIVVAFPKKRKHRCGSADMGREKRR